MPKWKRSRNNYNDKGTRYGAAVATGLPGRVQQKVERGELSPGQQEEEAAKLKARESEIGKFEQDMAKQIQEKRSELLEPIYNKINEAIANVAKEQNLSLVFDMGILLKSDPALDIIQLVKRELGI
ncbi:MAG: OmpH family outer membrane protein [Cyclobacteriaceae bacterium]|nr:OmpH family outer membrane protein [Cyclobacteriaceae bacterium]